MANNAKDYEKTLKTEEMADAFFSEVQEKLKEFINPESIKRTKTVNYFKAQIPDGLPHELKSIMRRGVYRIAQAADLRQAKQSLGIMENKYYDTQPFAMMKMRNKKRQG